MNQSHAVSTQSAAVKESGVLDGVRSIARRVPPDAAGILLSSCSKASHPALYFGKDLDRGILLLIRSCLYSRLLIPIYADVGEIGPIGVAFDQVCTGPLCWSRQDIPISCINVSHVFSRQSCRFLHRIDPGVSEESLHAMHHIRVGLAPFWQTNWISFSVTVNRCQPRDIRQHRGCDTCSQPVR
ncbi:hypothetical protein VTN96DRAFT_3944 [Rasamsonia emersonii]